MSFDYEAIKQEHIKEHDALVDRVGAYLTNMYSDQTHFIYELLQNAEDAEATEVKFRLYRDRLELEHDGCQFDEADVRGICKLIFGTKNEDLTKIGKFGVGFMSVYAHTRSPQIHSGDAHFTIDNYEQPREIPLQSSALGTLFIFPFNLEGKDPGESFDEISKRLQDLGASTLLFLKHIKSIGYEIDKEATGTYLRQTDPIQGTDFVSDITVIGQRNLQDVEEERWLVFERDVTHLAQMPEGSLTVEIAFRYSDDSQDVPKFECLSQSNLVVYFPTEKETHLGFLMQGPYKTTPARDNIPQSDNFNIALSEQSGDLVVEALRWLRDRNWLTVDVLNGMPLAYNKYHESYYSGRYEYEHNQYKGTLFEPIYNKVLAAIRNEALIPAYDEGYVSGKEAKLAGSEALRNLLDSARLQQFFNTDEPLRWISGEVTQDRTPNLRSYFINRLRIEEIDPKKFARRMDKDFLSRQSDNWMREFYEFASGQGGIWYILKSEPIIRLQNDSHVVPSANVYLPTERDSQFPTVKTEVCNSKKSLAFLRNLGLKEPDIVDEVRKLILPKYKNGEVDIVEEEHKQDIAVIVKAIRKVLDLPWYKKGTGLIQDLEQTPFLLAINAANDDKEFRRPTEIYLRSSELEMYFEGNQDAWFLSAGYEDYVADLQNLELKKLDIVDGVRELILPKYKNGEVDIVEEEHKQDIAVIVKAIRKVLDLSEWHENRTGLIRDLKQTPFLLAINAANDDKEFRRPTEIYLRSSELEMYFEGNQDAWFLSAGYEDYVADLEQIGVASRVRVLRKEPNQWDGYVTISRPDRGSDWHPHRRGLNGFDPDIKIDGLKFALTYPNIERAKFIWEHFLMPHKHSVSGEIESCPRQNFSPPIKSEKKVSTMGKLVCEMAWLPNGRGEFAVPAEITLDELSDDFSKDKQLAAKLGMEPSYQAYLDNAPEGIKRHVNKGLELERLEREHPEKLAKFIEEIEKSKSEQSNEADDSDYTSDDLYRAFNRGEQEHHPEPSPDRPERPNRGPRGKQEENGEATWPKFDKKRRLKLKIERVKDQKIRKFLREEYHGHCQICNYTFQKQDSTPYFEAVYLVSNEEGKRIDNPGNTLCLYPNHVVEFLYGTIKAPDIFDQIKSYQEGQSHHIEVQLCGEDKEIRYNQNHIVMLKELVEAVDLSSLEPQ